MTKDKYLNRWLWKWHIIAGLVTMPIMILLTITGVIYLFKENYEKKAFADMQIVAPENTRVSYAEQLKQASKGVSKEITRVTIPQRRTEATEFTSGKRRHKILTYVNPYTAQITGRVIHSDTLMLKIRKLHGELLSGKIGTYVVELVASWFFVLILTGIYVWWPSGKFSLGTFFRIRTQKGKTIFYRDLHSIVSFWLSLFLLIILWGAMPWTDVFGSSYKWVQKQTNSGYPNGWSPKKLQSSQLSGMPKTLDYFVDQAEGLNLKGKVSITLPTSTRGVFTISNRAFYLSDQKQFHFDQYSGKNIKSYDWSNVGFMMDIRQVLMRLHQGEYGLLNWYIVLSVGCLFLFSTIGGLLSYLYRKPAGKWGLPKVPDHFKIDKVVIAIIILMGGIFPLFGGSLLLIWLWDLRNRILQN